LFAFADMSILAVFEAEVEFETAVYVQDGHCVCFSVL